MNSPKKIIVGMSGGVDSSITAALLKEQGHDLSALFMKNWEEDDQDDCSSKKDYEDAKRICKKLNIKLNSINFSDKYWDLVFKRFLLELENGFTPNPDIYCNKEIKFNYFLKYALSLGADKIATGHYAKIIEGNGQISLNMPKDKFKDQTYFLYMLNQEILKDLLFPLEDLNKNEVKSIAKDLDIPLSEKKESMGICFIGNKKFKRFIGKYIKNKPGDIVNENNEIIGKHNGIFYTTIGQREGIGIGGMKNSKNLPWYVYKKDIENNKLFVCQGNDNELLFHETIFIKDLDITSSDIKDISNKNILCQVRHLGEKYKCSIDILKENLFSVKSKKLIRAPAQGQSLVIFEDNKCLGGGIITDG